MSDQYGMSVEPQGFWAKRKWVKEQRETFRAAFRGNDPARGWAAAKHLGDQEALSMIMELLAEAGHDELSLWRALVASGRARWLGAELDRISAHLDERESVWWDAIIEGDIKTIRALEASRSLWGERYQKEVFEPVEEIEEELVKIPEWEGLEEYPEVGALAAAALSEEMDALIEAAGIWGRWGAAGETKAIDDLMEARWWLQARQRARPTGSARIALDRVELALRSAGARFESETRSPARGSHGESGSSVESRLRELEAKVDRALSLIERLAAKSGIQ